MSSTKSVLLPFKVFDNATMDTDLESPVTVIHGIDSLVFIVDWSASTAVGAIEVQVTKDKDDSWHSLSFPNAISITGASGSHEINIANLAFSKIRLKYKHTSGSGTMTASIQGRGV